MNLDRDLQDALRPLAGDPVADAARVLAALPAPPPASPTPKPQRPWLPWTLLALGAAAGVVVGRALSPEPAPKSDPPVRESSPTQDPQPVKPPEQPDKEDKEKEKLPDKPPDPMTSEQEYLRSLGVMAFGPIEVDEPIDGVQQLEAGQWRARFGSVFRTGDSQAGIFVPANDARARFDRDTEARVGPELVQLEFGRAWIDTGDRNAAVRVLCGASMYAAMETGCGGVFTRSPSGVEVLSLRGTIVLHLETDTVALATHESVIVDALGAGKKTKVPFTAPATSWMVHMITMSADPNELPERVKEVVAAFGKDEFRDEARLEILKLGSLCVWVLADDIEQRLPRDRDQALRATDLLAQIVDWKSATHALPLLMQEDPDLRVTVFRGAFRATGIDVGTNEDFWRNETRDKRRLAVERWQKELKKR